jgi:tetratricopeptide (TPR) repeat protein
MLSLSLLAASALAAGGAPALYAEAASLESAGKSAAAVVKYRDAIAENPFFGKAWVGLGVLQLSRDNLSEATNALRRALEIDPADAEAAAALGRAELLLGDVEEARKVFAALSETHPESPEGPLGRAVMLAEAGDFAEAIAATKEALRLSPRHYRATLLLGDLQQRAGDDAAALSTLRAAFDLNPQSRWGPYHLGLYHYRRRDYRQAESELARALSVAPDFVPALRLNGATQVALGKWSPARRTYEVLADSYRRGDRYERDHPVYLYDMAVCASHENDREAALGRALAARANDELCRGRYEEFLIDNPDRFPVSSEERKKLSRERFRRAEMLAERGDRAFSMAEYRRSVRLHPLDVTVRLRIADLYGQMGYPERRVHEFRLVTRDLDPNNVEIRDRLEFAERNLQGRFPARWGVRQYELPPPATRVAVFPLATGEEGRIETGLVAARILEDMLHSLGRLAVTNYRGGVLPATEMADRARSMGAICYVAGTIEEKGEDLRLSARLVDAKSGTTIASNRWTRRGNDRVLWALQDAGGMVFANVPWAGRLLDYDREHGLVSVGRLDGAEAGMEFVVCEPGSVRVDAVTGDYVGVGENEIGRVRLQDVDERVSTFVWDERRLANRLAPGQVLVPAPPAQEKKSGE